MNIFSIVTDPIGKLIDTVGDAVGVPEGIQSAAKVAVGVATGNPFTFFNGMTDLCTELSKGGGHTEHVAPKNHQGPHGYAPQPCPDVCGGFGSGPMRSIASDPSLSLEEKMMAVLSRILDTTDREIEQVLKELERGQGNGKGGSSQKLEMRLQTLMQKRMQMFQLMSNMSEKFHEMAKSAIQNLGRA